MNMHILTNISDIRTAKSTLKSCDIDFDYMKKSTFDLASYGPTMIITGNPDEGSKAAKRFNNIQIVGPNLKFPGYKCDIYTGFDITSKQNTCPMDIGGQVCFVNTHGNASKVFGMKLESVFKDVKIFGNGFGISSIGPVNLSTTLDLYKNFEIIAADAPAEIFKALYLGKPCVTNIPFQYCHNIFDEHFSPHKCVASSEQKSFALENTYFDVFSHIFENTHNQYIIPKLEFHKKQYV